MTSVDFIILAAGRATRFGSHSKVLYNLCGKPVLEYVIDLTSGSNCILVASDEVANSIVAQRATHVVLQNNPSGTADAFRLGLPYASHGNHVFVLFGDSPLISRNSIEVALKAVDNHDIVFGMFRADYENDYGRIVQTSNGVEVIEKIYHPEKTEFYNAGWICLNKDFILTLPKIEQIYKELYITQYVSLAKNPLGIEVLEEESIGINSLEDYIRAREILNHKLINSLFMNGVQFSDPSSVTLSHDTKIGHGSIVHGHVCIGNAVEIGCNSKVMPFTYLENCKIGDNCTIGPFAYLHGSSVAGSEVHVGAFCEVKKSNIGSGTKAKHLSYIGDAEIGRKVNVGAGTVMCNYDGIKKSKSIVGDMAFLGGNCAYVAPVEIGEMAYIGAGTTVRGNVEPSSVYVCSPKIVRCKRNDA